MALMRSSSKAPVFGRVTHGEEKVGNLGWSKRCSGVGGMAKMMPSVWLLLVTWGGSTASEGRQWHDESRVSESCWWHSQKGIL